MQTKKQFSLFLILLLFLTTFSSRAQAPFSADSSVLIIKTDKSSGTGFACVYRDQEFIATNLHVLEGFSKIEVKSISGKVIEFSGKLIAADDADICMLSIKGKFADKGITPLKFMDKVAENSKVGDEIICLGNSLGNGVVTSAKGEIKAYGHPRIEITAPVVKGNSGGPIIHVPSGDVVGLVTEAVINKLDFDELGVAASKAEDTAVPEISYFGHRIDSVSKWTGTSIEEYLKQNLTLSKSTESLINTTLFLADKSGWENDVKLADAWKEYSTFLENAAGKTSVTEYVNDLGVVVRRDVKIKRRSVSEADYQTALAKFKRAIDWKIKNDQEALNKTKPIGFRQTEKRKLAMEFGDKVSLLYNSL